MQYTKTPNFITFSNLWEKCVWFLSQNKILHPKSKFLKRAIRKYHKTWNPTIVQCARENIPTNGIVTCYVKVLSNYLIYIFHIICNINQSAGSLCVCVCGCLCVCVIVNIMKATGRNTSQVNVIKLSTKIHQNVFPVLHGLKNCAKKKKCSCL